MKRLSILFVLSIVSVFFFIETVEELKRQRVHVFTDNPLESKGLLETVEYAPSPDSASSQNMGSKDLYGVVIKNNLFNKHRKELIADSAGDKKNGAKDNFSYKNYVLFGTMIINGEKSALLGGGRIPHKRRTKRWIRVGDEIDRFRVLAIEKDRIFIAVEDIAYEIRLDDRGKVLKMGSVSKVRSGNVSDLNKIDATIESPETSPNKDRDKKQSVHVKGNGLQQQKSTTKLNKESDE